VQKTVWIDAGAGNDFVQVRSGNAILIDQTEQANVGRNDSQMSAFHLDKAAEIVGAASAPINGRLTEDARFSLRLNQEAETQITLSAAATSDNNTIADLVVDLVRALAGAGLGQTVSASYRNGRLVLTGQSGIHSSLTIAVANDAAVAIGLGPVSATGAG